MSEASPEIQERTDEHFGELMLKWQAFFEHATDSDAVAQMDTAYQELNESWPHMQELCIYSGMSMYPEVQADKSVETIYEQVEDNVAISTGVWISHKEGEPARIYFSFFLYSETEILEPTCFQTRQFNAYLETGGSIIPIEKIEEAFNEDIPDNIESSAEDVHEYLSKSSDNLVKMLRSTAFRRLTRQRQETVIRNYVQRAETLSQLRGQQITVETDCAFKPRLIDNKIDYDPVIINGRVITAVCHGLTTLETQKVSEKAIRRDIDMISRDSGLCLLIEDFSDQDPEVEVEKGEVLLIPISGQNVEMMTEDIY